MITTAVEYEKAQSELRDLQQRLAQLQRDHPIGEKGFTKAGIRKLIARLNVPLPIRNPRPVPDGAREVLSFDAGGANRHRPVTLRLHLSAFGQMFAR